MTVQVVNALGGGSLPATGSPNVRYVVVLAADDIRDIAWIDAIGGYWEM
jgi:hypothetical protein